MENDNISVKIKLSLDDYRKWNMSLVFTKKLIFATCLVVLLMFVSALVSYHSHYGLDFFMDNFIPLLGVLALVFIALPLFVFFNAKKSFLKDASMQEERTYGFDGEGFTITTGHGNSRMTWDRIYRVVEDKKNICIYSSRIKAFLIPKRFITSESDIKALVALLKDKMKK